MFILILHRQAEILMSLLYGVDGRVLSDENIKCTIRNLSMSNFYFPFRLVLCFGWNVVARQIIPFVEITERTDDRNNGWTIFIHIAQMAFNDSYCQMTTGLFGRITTRRLHRRSGRFRFFAPTDSYHFRYEFGIDFLRINMIAIYWHLSVWNEFEEIIEFHGPIMMNTEYWSRS